ncbi:hypothetical protein EV138_0733 [Kribbella voronezhensis]|uniref:DUF1700 domain-containing protein n=1 Tax=Kribbella voronezhensis TaxID=2512212 RepID=A0A4R7T693_9ACTN|nr:hypothetical protein [Kribbella voronezhensis]TDU87215.1 hypothetical protein EV138_0733 [Kribbella voronezhensis]
MTNVQNEADRLVDAYLDYLAKAAEPLPAERRTELVAEVSAHIDEERAAGVSSAAEVRAMLARLGDPDEIVAAATDGLVLVDRYRPRVRGREVVTLLLLLFGGMVLFGWFIGVYLLWTADRWNFKEKLLGTLVWPFGFAGAITFLEIEAALPTWLEITVGAAVLLAPLAMLAVLLRTAQPARAAA